MYDISVVIDNEGRPALQLTKGRYDDTHNVMSKYPQWVSGNEDKSVVILDMCGEDTLSQRVIIIKN